MKQRSVFLLSIASGLWVWSNHAWIRKAKRKQAMKHHPSYDRDWNKRATNAEFEGIINRSFTSATGEAPSWKRN